MEALIALAIIVAVPLIFWLGVVAPRSWPMIAYFAIWSFFPKAFRLAYLTGDSLDLPVGITLYNVVELIVVLSILLAIAVRRSTDTPRDVPPYAKFLLWTFAIAALIWPIFLLTSVVELVPVSVSEIWEYISFAIEPQQRILPLLSMAYGIIVAVGAIKLITTQRDVELILACFFLSGLEMAAECVAVYHLGLGGPITQWSVHNSGRFMSLIHTDYDMVGFACTFAFCAGCYFSIAKRSKALWLFTMLTLVPIPAGFQRAAVLSVIGAGSIIWISRTRARHAVFQGLMVLGIVSLLMLMGIDQTIVEGIQARMGGAVRPDYLSGETIEARQALWWRTLDVLRVTFPWGVGPEMVRWAMNASAVPPEFSENVPVRYAFVYDSLITGTRTTGTHQMYLEFLVEHGILALGLAACYLLLLVRCLLSWIKNQRSGLMSNGYLLQSIFLGMWIAVFLHDIFDSTFLPHTFRLSFPLLVLLCPQLASAPVAVASSIRLPQPATAS